MAVVDIQIAPADNDDEGEEEKKGAADRSRNLLDGARETSPIVKRLNKIFDAVSKAFQDQSERSDELDDLWDCYHCILNRNQFYNADAQIYVPIIRDAINARITRFSNQLFPPGGRMIESSSTDGTQPSEIIALIEHYLRCAKAKTKVVKPMLRNGDVEGQLNLYVNWEEYHRQLVSRETHGPVISMDGEEIEDLSEEIEDIDVEDVAEGVPCFEVLHDSDVAVTPSTADSVEQALQRGGCVAIVRRYSKEMVDQLVEEGEIDGKEADKLTPVGFDADHLPGMDDLAKPLLKAIGLRSRGKVMLLLEVWSMLPLDEGGKYSEKGTDRLCKMWFGLNRIRLGAKRNPNWNDRCSLFSEPVEKIAGVFKGMSPIKALAPIQYDANDAANEMADVDHFAAMPIIARKPGVSTAPLIINLAAVWDVGPDDVKFLEFPNLSDRGMARIQRAIQTIYNSLSVNPSMIAQTQSGGGKSNQARIAQEQAVDLLTTSEAVSVIEDFMTPVVAHMVDLDYQHRDRVLTVRAYGEMGIKTAMTDIKPLQNRHRYEFVWSGAQSARNTAMFQQKIAFMNVARGVEPLLEKAGYRFNPAPIFEDASLSIFGPKVAPLVLTDMRRELSIDAHLENALLKEGHDVYVHPMDPDNEHLPIHQQAFEETGDPTGEIQVHMARHLQSRQIKMQAAMKSAMQQTIMRGQGMQGVPGGAGRGVPGTPAPGGQPQPQRPMRGPPGMIHPDVMPRAGGIAMPRKM